MCVSVHGVREQRRSRDAGLAGVLQAHRVGEGWVGSRLGLFLRPARSVYPPVDCA